MITQVDKLGRIVLKKKIREKYGRQFIVVASDEGILLKPTSKDPFKDIDKISDKLKKYSLKELSKMGEEEAEKEVERKLKRIIK